MDYRHNMAHSAPSEDDLAIDVSIISDQSPLSQQSFPCARNSSVLLTEPSEGASESPAQFAPPYATDVLFSRELVTFILNDYITYVYPLVPVIHRPTFEVDFSQNRDLQDEDFLTLIISLCAVTVALLPSKLEKYRGFSSPLPFVTRTDMVNHCYKLNQGLRDTSFFDTVSHQKWASSFLISLAFHQTGNTNFWRMFEVEAMQLLRLLEVQHVSSYKGLDAIEGQLRKKAFWLMFYGYIHQTYNLRNERLAFLDTTILRDINLEDLMPAPVDDEFISASGILPCPEDVASASLTAGFNLHSRIFAAGLEPLCANAKQSCICCETKDPVRRLAALKDRLNHLKYMLDAVLPAFRPWNTKVAGTTTSAITTDLDEVANTQREAIRANVHVTHLWLQIMLLDQIDALVAAQTLSVSTSQGAADPLTPPSSSSTQMTPDTASWDEREDICRQLLHTLHSFSHSGLEPNGISVVSTSFRRLPKYSHAARRKRRKKNRKKMRL